LFCAAALPCVPRTRHSPTPPRRHPTTTNRENFGVVLPPLHLHARAFARHAGADGLLRASALGALLAGDGGAPLGAREVAALLEEAGPEAVARGGLDLPTFLRLCRTQFV